MGTTPVYGFPYPEPGDAVRDGDDVIKALAQTVEAALSPPWVALTPLGTNYGLRAGYFDPAYRVFTNGRVELRGGLTKSANIASGDIVFTLPTEGRPTRTVSIAISVYRSGNTANATAGRLDIATTGVATVHVIDAQAVTSVAMDGAQFSMS